MLSPDLLLSDHAQQSHLRRVSRSFALSIPLLRPQLANQTAHAYLHLRIVDTIEDELCVSPAARIALLRRLAELYRDRLSDLPALSRFAACLLTALSPQAAAEIRALLADYLPLARRSHMLEPHIRDALCRCAIIMAQDMADTLEQGAVQNYAQLETYCYASAGVVGQLLRRLFAASAPGMSHGTAEGCRRGDTLQDSLAVSFAQGLQMVNMLRDAPHDHLRGRVWLTPDELRSPRFAGVCRAHLDSGLAFAGLFSARHACDIRHFCLFNAALAYAALRLSIRGSLPRPGHGEVRSLLLLTGAAARSDTILRGCTGLLTRGLLPAISISPDGLLARVTRWQD